MFDIIKNLMLKQHILFSSMLNNEKIVIAYISKLLY